MAKGRRLTVSRSERYLGAYAGGGYTNVEVVDAPEFREEDVWSTTVDGGGYANGRYGESEWTPRAPTMPPPTIPRRDRQVGGLTLAFEESAAGRTVPSSTRIVHQLRPGEGLAPPRRQQQQRQMASSAPVNVPDWNKILRVNSAESMLDPDGGEFEDERVDPPHEYLARSRGNNATSVFEGVGRTLKGRDLRRLRDTVWSQTGFDG